MSTDIETANVAEDTTRTEETDRGVIVRTFAADITAGDGRTIDLRIVPFGERATVADGLGGLPKGVPYEEEWMPGVFDKQLKAANRVLFNFEHERGIRGVIGHGTELRHAADGYHGSFKVHETADGDKALMMAREGVLGGASLQAYPRRSIKSAAGVVQRVLAHLDAVALCRTPAFAGATVTAIRVEDEFVIDQDLLPIEMKPELVERLRARGIVLPDRYQAHPDITDTPPDGGTSDDGTRQTETKASDKEA